MPAPDPPLEISLRDLAELVDLTRNAQRAFLGRLASGQPATAMKLVCRSYEHRLDALLNAILRPAPTRPTLCVPVWSPPFSRERLNELLDVIDDVRRDRRQAKIRKREALRELQREEAPRGDRE